MPFIALKNLKGFRFWADVRKRTGFDGDPENFTKHGVGPFTAMCQEYNDQREAAKDEDASRPDSLKKLTNWAPWNESFQNYLRQILNDKETPEVLNPEDFASPTEYLIEATILRGRHFELDNPRFFRKLMSFKVNGEGGIVIHQEIREDAGWENGVFGIEDTMRGHSIEDHAEE